MQYPCIWSNLNQRTYSDVESWQPMQLYKDWVGMLHPYMYPSCHHKAWTSAFFDLHPVCFFNRGDGRYLRRRWDVRHFTDSNCFRSFSFMLCCNWEDKTENAEGWFLGMWWFFFHLVSHFSLGHSFCGFPMQSGFFCSSGRVTRKFESLQFQKANGWKVKITPPEQSTRNPSVVFFGEFHVCVCVFFGWSVSHHLQWVLQKSGIFGFTVW